MNIIEMMETQTRLDDTNPSIYIIYTTLQNVSRKSCKMALH